MTDSKQTVLGSFYLLVWPVVVIHDPTIEKQGLLEPWPEIGGWLISLQSWGSGTPSDLQVLAHELVHLAEQSFQIELTETQVDAISSVVVAGLLNLGLLHTKVPEILEDPLEN